MRLTPVVAAIVLSVAACSSSESSAPSESSPPSAGGEPGAGTSVPPVEAPEGSQVVEAVHLGIAFAVPDVYVTLDPTELSADDYDSDWFAELAGSVDVPAAQLTTALRSNLDLFLFAPVGSSGFSDNITVEAQPDEELPTDDEARAQLEPLGVTDITVTDRDADGVDVVQVAYHDSAEDRAGYDVYVEHRDGRVVLSVTAADDATAGDVGELLAGTLRVAG